MATCGWALHLMDQLDQETLVAEISNWVGHPITAHWRIISSGLQGNVVVSKGGQNDDIQALHFECDAKDIPVVIPHLKRIYSSTRDATYPQGIKLRLIPIINKVSNPKTRSKVERL